MSYNMIDKNVYQFVGSCFYKLKTSDSWRGRKDVSCTFTKEEKESLNAMVFFILLIKEKEEKGEEVNINGCIAYLLKRLIRKSLTWDAKPENMDDIRRRLPNYDKEVEDYVNAKFLAGTNKGFFNFVNTLAGNVTDHEREIFSVAKNHTNLVEFEQIRHVIFQEDEKKIEERLYNDAEKHNTNEYISHKLETLVSRLSWARNIVRWQGYGTTLPCNILCHMLETAVLAWLMAYEVNIIEGYEKYVPEQAFLVGLFHDISEIWTDDIPSPCKDEIGKAHGSDFRRITEEQEVEALNKYFYSTFNDKRVSDFFKEKVMLDELEDKDFHAFMKKADYFSADFEVYWNIVCGLRHWWFPHILKESACIEKRTPAAVELLNEWIIDLGVIVDWDAIQKKYDDIMKRRNEAEVRVAMSFEEFKLLFDEIFTTRYLKP